MNSQPTIRQQAESFLNLLETRRQRKAKPRTIKIYQSYVRNWIVPLAGDEELAGFKNAALKRFMGQLNEADLAPATKIGVVNCLKAIIGSAVDEEGEELFPRKWNNEFADVPVINPRAQHAPSIDSAAITKAIVEAPAQYSLLFALLAGTGLRISEALGLKTAEDGKSNVWIGDRIRVRGQVQDGNFVAPKTEAGYREVDVHASLSAKLVPGDGYLFGGAKPLPLSTIYSVKERLGIEQGFHAFRRYRTTRLREQRVPEDIIRFWIGHEDRSQTDRYSRLAENTEVRKCWAEKAGLGFDLN